MNKLHDLKHLSSLRIQYTVPPNRDIGSSISSLHYSRGGHHGGGSSSRGHHGGGGSRGRNRYGKREAVDEDDNEVDEDDVERELSVLNLLEPDECFHRLICDLSTGAMPKSPIDFIATMFTGE